jgi:hypothetical protein
VLSSADETPDIVAGDLEEVAGHLVRNAPQAGP